MLVNSVSVLPQGYNANIFRYGLRGAMTFAELYSARGASVLESLT
jgi:hypothetical protein